MTLFTSFSLLIVIMMKISKAGTNNEISGKSSVWFMEESFHPGKASAPGKTRSGNSGNIVLALAKSIKPEKGKSEKRQRIRYLFRNTTSFYNLRRDGKDAASVWIRNASLEVFVHGFTPSGEEPRIFDVANEYLKKGKVNIVVVDWTELSTYPIFRYNDVVDSSYYAGQDLGEFLIKLQTLNLITYDKVHIIGYSVGAHVAGVTGDWINHASKRKIGRITGLDPAGPLFDEGNGLPKDTGRVLNSDDAEFVDIIHCNMENYGSKVQAGHADFYPNGGETQPGCKLEDDIAYGCSHSKCFEFFQQSINQKQFLACSCTNWGNYVSGLCRCDGAVLMGENLNTKRASGRYYLKIV